MKQTIVINLRSGQPYDQYIGRAGHGQDGYFGNPFKVHLNRGETLGYYREYFYNRLKTDPEFKQRIHQLKGKVLACFCKPNACHGDIIADYLNGLEDV